MDTPSARPGSRLTEAPARMVDQTPACWSTSCRGAAHALLALSALPCAQLGVNRLLNLERFASIVFIENRYLSLLAAALPPVILLRCPRAHATTGSAGRRVVRAAAFARAWMAVCAEAQRMASLEPRFDGW